MDVSVDPTQKVPAAPTTTELLRKYLQFLALCSVLVSDMFKYQPGSSLPGPVKVSVLSQLVFCASHQSSCR